MNPYTIHEPTGIRLPILISVPHCGTIIPDELLDQFDKDQITLCDDTDWFVDRLYDFAPSIGITMITAKYSRWVIDLNRDPDNKPLYSDGRVITGLCPVTNFLGEPLYIDNRTEMDNTQVQMRKKRYYLPYHQKLKELLNGLRSEFGKVLLWDCHSIRQYVETIYREKFPDLILGDSDGLASSPQTIQTAFDALNTSAYTLSHNFPFKGGYITRTYGRPLEHQQALQLEMTKINYMDDTETQYDISRADKMRELLRGTLLKLSEQLMGKIC